jgi:hypothetical protein
LLRSSQKALGDLKEMMATLTGGEDQGDENEDAFSIVKIAHGSLLEKAIERETSEREASKSEREEMKEEEGER